jgi:hypothetical protein
MLSFLRAYCIILLVLASSSYAELSSSSGYRHPVRRAIHHAHHVALRQSAGLARDLRVALRGILVSEPLVSRDTSSITSAKLYCSNNIIGSGSSSSNSSSSSGSSQAPGVVPTASSNSGGSKSASGSSTATTTSPSASASSAYKLVESHVSLALSCLTVPGLLCLPNRLCGFHAPILICHLISFHSKGATSLMGGASLLAPIRPMERSPMLTNPLLYVALRHSTNHRYPNRSMNSSNPLAWPQSTPTAMPLWPSKRLRPCLARARACGLPPTASTVTVRSLSWTRYICRPDVEHGLRSG